MSLVLVLVPKAGHCVSGPSAEAPASYSHIHPRQSGPVLQRLRAHESAPAPTALGSVVAKVIAPVAGLGAEGFFAPVEGWPGNYPQGVGGCGAVV